MPATKVVTKSRNVRKHTAQLSDNICHGIPLYKLDPTAPENSESVKKILHAQKCYTFHERRKSKLATLEHLLAEQAKTIQALEQKNVLMQEIIDNQKQRIDTLESEAIKIGMSQQVLASEFSNNMIIDSAFESMDSKLEHPTVQEEEDNNMTTTRTPATGAVGEIDHNLNADTIPHIRGFSALPILDGDISLYLDQNSYDSDIVQFFDFNLSAENVSSVANPSNWLNDSNFMEQDMESTSTNIHIDQTTEDLPSNELIGQIDIRDASGSTEQKMTLPIMNEDGLNPL